MNDVQFNEPEVTTQRPAASTTPKGLYKLAIDLGLAKDYDSARTVLLATAFIAIVIAIVFPFLV